MSSENNKSNGTIEKSYTRDKYAEDCKSKVKVKVRKKENLEGSSHKKNKRNTNIKKISNYFTPSPNKYTFSNVRDQNKKSPESPVSTKFSNSRNDRKNFINKDINNIKNMRDQNESRESMKSSQSKSNRRNLMSKVNNRKSPKRKKSSDIDNSKTSKLSTFFAPNPKKSDVSSSLSLSNGLLGFKIPKIRSNKENSGSENNPSSSSYQKYGVCVPSYEDILLEKKSYENYKKQIDNLTNLVTPLPDLSPLNEDESPVSTSKSRSDRRNLIRKDINNTKNVTDRNGESRLSMKTSHNTSNVTDRNEESRLSMKTSHNTSNVTDQNGESRLSMKTSHNTSNVTDRNGESRLSMKTSHNTSSRRNLIRKSINNGKSSKRKKYIDIDSSKMRKMSTYFVPSPKKSGVSSSLNMSNEFPRFKKSKNRNKENSGSKNNNSSSSYQKYGVCVPSYEDILLEKKSYENYKKQIDNLTDLVTPLPDVFPLNEDVQEVEILDCKYMSDEKLTATFKDNLKYLDDIYYENNFCKRHDLYKKGLKCDLQYNTSMILFTNDQKQLLASRLVKRYGSSSSLSDYYFKVLLPELCFKIFCDEYSLSAEDASKYLEERPVEM